MPREELIFRVKQWVRETIEVPWFDRTHRVHTSGDVSLDRAGVLAANRSDSEDYVGARPANIREAIRAAPLVEVEDYTFIDIGSGKGRAVFVAAEFPFREVIGVEFSEPMHARSVSNAQSFRYRGKDGSHIHLLHGNAKEFDFPDAPLVVYFFNPFGAETMQTVLNNLQTSLDRKPRPVIVILLWPKAGQLVAALPGMQQVCATRRYEIFQVNAPRDSA